MVSVAATSPSLPKATTFVPLGARFPFAGFPILPALLGGEAENRKVGAAVAGDFDFGVLADESDEIDCVLKHVNFLICPSVGQPRSEWVPLPRSRSEFFWRVRSGLFAKQKTKSSIVRGNRNPEGPRTHEEGCRARSFQPRSCADRRVDKE